MNPGRFFVSNYPYTMPMRNPGIFSRIFSGFRGINWTSLLTNANKTLNVVNQTIPLIRQTGPMFNNLRSMIQLTRAFNSETGRTNNKNTSNREKKLNLQAKPVEQTISIKKENNDQSESPSFFI